MTPPAPSDPVSFAVPGRGPLVRRHRLSTRLWHWINAAALLVLLMSGLMIFNAHPRLYWGEFGANPDRAWLEIGATARGEGALRVGPLLLHTTGVLGVYTDGAGQVEEIAFPGWATIPSSYSLADARLWHLAFAWVLASGLLAYLLWSLANGHIRRDLHVPAREWQPGHLWQEAKGHARLLRRPGHATSVPVGPVEVHAPPSPRARYNTLQKIAYAVVLLGLLPLMIATGLAMSPGMDAGWPWLSAVWGGRQSARSVHFIAAFGLVAFFVVHILMVLLAGPLNELRSIVTGWYRLPPPPPEMQA